MDHISGLVALATAPGATLMVIPAITAGYLHLVNLSPCPAPPEDHTPGAPSTHHPPRVAPAQPRKDHILAHESALATISVTPSGRMVATTSEAGTLVRIWDVVKGQHSHEFRRGIDRAHIYGVAFRPDEKECCAWSDKGTVHVFSLDKV
jgi:WD40 repeat protein